MRCWPNFIQPTVKSKIPSIETRLVYDHELLHGYSPLSTTTSKNKPNQIRSSFPAASMSKKRKWKIGRYRKKSHAKKSPNETRYLLQKLGESAKHSFHPLSSSVCPRPALRFFVSVSRFSRFSGNRQYNCRIVSAADVHGCT